ncbi:MAG: TonB-dependent receptor [Cyclobacteriaceae bacterium]|nr:TonB-dependent receptor [Cyclobacteriaceae bacterium]
MRQTLLLCMTFFLFATITVAQERSVTGTVTSAEDGTTLPGVSVLEKGTSNGTVTDVNGQYKITVTGDNSVLLFTFVGMATQEVSVGSRSSININLETDITQLSEVVVIGYGTVLKKELTGSVASVSADEIGKLPVLSVNQALQGQAAGVFVTANSGTPGGGISVRVRGQTSINASNDPLYIVDGVPVEAGNLVQQGFGGEQQNALAGLNPQDIESIQVLKDASTMAIYGARAANGVVLITTKTGKSGESRINFNTWTGWANETGRVEMVGSQDWIDLQNEARANDGLTAKTNADWGWDGTTNTNWMDEIFRTARISEHNLSASGGSENTTYYVSGAYRDEEGVIIGSGLERFSGRINLQTKASEKLSFGTRIGISNDKNSRIMNDNNIYGVYSASVLTPSIKPVYDENGNYVDALPSFNTNPVRSALVPRYDISTLKVITNLNVNYNIFEGLDFRSDFSYDLTEVSEDLYAPKSTSRGRGSDGLGQFNYIRRGTYAIEPTLRYTKTINNSHKINAILGSTFQERSTISSRVEGSGYGRESLTYITSAATITSGSSNRTDYSFNSFFGRVNYSMDEKYNLSASLRRDGSSRFGSGNKFGTFYALGASWIFSDESFMSGIDFIDLGKLRVSYGVTGNDQIGDFTYIGSWTGSANYQDLPASAPNNIENPNLKWEETSALDIGLELSLFQKVDFELGYFYQNTTDLLYGRPLPRTTGFAIVQENLGNIENKGLEINIRSVNVESNDFLWKTNFNIAFTKNKVLSLIDVNDEPLPQGFASAIIIGEPLNTFYGLKFMGVDPTTGESIFEDYNGDGSSTTDDNQVIGDHNPDFYGGFTNTFSYKGLSLDVFFQFVQGVDVYNYSQGFAMFPGSPWGLNTSLLDRWQNPGDITDIPKLSTVRGLNGADNSRFLEDGSYVRLKNIKLSYEFPQDLISKAKIKNLTVYALGSNILTFTKYTGADPEISSLANTSTAKGTDFLSFPQAKMYSIGLNIGL